ncbi:MAG: nitroreductase, partial [Pseudomonadales bacterium]|nr:nitroreductase [Pseudomonadales bacterium]
MKQTPVDFSVRDAAAGVNNLFVQRWSPRAYLPTLIPEHDLHTIFDAARWSPSCYNEQPWQFISSTPATHAQFLRLLVEANQQWAKHAPVLGFVIANKYFARNGKPNVHALFDAGAAWMAVNLQASLLG